MKSSSTLLVLCLICELLLSSCGRQNNGQDRQPKKLASEHVIYVRSTSFTVSYISRSLIHRIGHSALFIAPAQGAFEYADIQRGRQQTLEFGTTVDCSTREYACFYARGYMAPILSANDIDSKVLDASALHAKVEIHDLREGCKRYHVEEIGAPFAKIVDYDYCPDPGVFHIITRATQNNPGEDFELVSRTGLMFKIR